MLAFIGSSELILAAFVGLLLFGGRLPDVMREVGKVWFGFRRSLNDLKRETGFDEAMRDIKRETDDLRNVSQDWRKDMDPFAGPGREEPPADAEAEAPPQDEAKPGASEEPEGESPSERRASDPGKEPPKP